MAISSRRKEAKHARLSGYLRNLIKRGKLSVGDPIPPEHALAKRFGCSRGTVRQAIDTLVREGLVERRWGAGNFVTERRLGAGGKLIAMIAQNTANSERARLAQAFAAAAQERGLSMLLHVTDYPIGRYDPENERRFIDRLTGMDVAGVIKFPTAYDWSPDGEWDYETERTMRARLHDLGIPFVILNDFWGDCRDAHHVAFDECAAMEMAIEHLCELGHERIGFVGETEHRADVLRAFHEGLSRRGLSLDDEQTLFASRRREGFHLEKFFSDGRTNPTALVFLYARQAVRAVKELRNMGLQVPGDVSIVNLNGPPAHSDELDLTTAVPPDDLMAEKAVDIILKHPGDDAICHFILKPGFHVGKTTAPPRRATPEVTAGAQGRPRRGRIQR